MLRRVIVSVALIVPLLAVAGGLSRWLTRHAPTPTRVAGLASALLVDTVRLRRETVDDEIIGYGSARADQAAVLTAEVAAAVKRLVPVTAPGAAEAVALEEGVQVARGTLLIELDDREYRQRLTRATELATAAAADRTRLGIEEQNTQRLLGIADGESKVARDELRRVSGLFENDQASKREYDLVRLTWYQADRARQSLANQVLLFAPRRTQLDALRAARAAEVELARLDLERCRIAAPFTGYIERLGVEVGVRVQPGVELLRIVSLDRIEIPIELPVSARPRIADAAICTLRMESLPEVSWSGTIARFGPVADTRSRTFRAYVEVDNSRRPVKLQPGFFVSATVKGRPIRDVFLVPRTAIVDGTHIFIANDSANGNGSVAHRRRIIVVRTVKDRAVIESGVADGDPEAVRIAEDDRVIISNLDRLADGVRVEVAGGEDQP